MWSSPSLDWVRLLWSVWDISPATHYPVWLACSKPTNPTAHSISRLCMMSKEEIKEQQNSLCTFFAGAHDEDFFPASRSGQKRTEEAKHTSKTFLCVKTVALPAGWSTAGVACVCRRVCRSHWAVQPATVHNLPMPAKAQTTAAVDWKLCHASWSHKRCGTYRCEL